MPANITLGDNYQIDENSNGNLVIIDSSGNPVLEHTDGGGWSINTTADINDLTDSASGNTVYDASTETFGDGNQTGNFNSVNARKLDNERRIDPSRSDLFAAINQAVSEISPEGGKIVVPKPNEGVTYAPTTDLDLSSGANNQDQETPIRIEGDVRGAGNVNGRGVTVDMSSGAKIILEDATTSTFRRNVTIEHIKFEGGTVGLELANSGGIKECLFHDLMFKGFTEALSTSGFDIIETAFENVSFRGNDQHINHTGGDYNDVVFNDCSFTSGQAADAINLGGIKLDGVWFDGCLFQGQVENVFNITGAVQKMDIDGYFENNNKTAAAAKSPITIPGNIISLRISVTEKTSGSVSPWIDHSGAVAIDLTVENSKLETTGINLVETTSTNQRNLTLRGIDTEMDLDTSSFINPILENVNTGGTTTFSARPTVKLGDESYLCRGYEPVDVRSRPPQVNQIVSYHDGSGTNTEGPAARVAGSWVSLVDGSTIN